MSNTKMKSPTLIFTKEYYDKSKAPLEIEIPLIPQELSYSYNPNFSSQNILGRMTPIYVYSGGSGEKYSFSVTLHEDIINRSSKHKSLMDFVDDIKSLSYPNVSPAGLVQDYPRVLFQLGDISAWVIVETSLNWNKPFRDGRYILVNITFDLTVVETLEKIKTYKISDEVGTKIEGDYKYLTNSLFVYTEAQSLFDKTVDYSFRYGVNLDDFIGTEIGVEQRYIVDTAKWDEGILRMKTLFGSYHSQMSHLNKLPKSFTAINNLWDDYMYLSSENLVRSGSKKTRSYASVEKDLNSILNNYKKFIDVYHKEINLDLTESEKKQILDEFTVVIQSMLKVAEGVLGYGPAQ